MTEPPAASHRARYLALLKKALLDLHYLDNEVRLEYLASLPKGATPDDDSLRDPPRRLEVRYKKLLQARLAGQSTGIAKGAAYTPYTDMGKAALDHLGEAMADVDERGVPGDVAVCGVGRGGGAILVRAVLDADGVDRQLWLADSFLATDSGGEEGDRPARARMRADLNQVRDGFARFDLFDESLRFLQGRFATTLADRPDGDLALLHIGGDGCFEVETILGHLLGRMSVGGTVIVEGVGRPVVARRLEEFRATAGLRGAIQQIGWDTVAWEVTDPVPVGSDTAPVVAGLAVPLAPPAPSDTVELTVVVVFYDMAREAKRTLQSLARSYQRGIDDVSYEVLVIDNGSHEDQRLDADQVASYGPEFRLIHLEDASPSPTVALNTGIAQARGNTVALMIDGAHVLTPGVFTHALTAMETYEPAVVAIQQWYVGPGQQGDAQQAGYEQTAEDRLFSNIRWPTDGYRLFEIGHFIGDRDWFDGIIESNCLFVSRSLLEQVGGFDDNFDMPGGGYANLEIFERMHANPGTTPVTVLGEGSFHQFHGGTTTNVSDEAVRRSRIVSYREHFAETRGRGLNGLANAVHYIGTMDTKAARRTRSRREYLLSFNDRNDPITSTVAEPQPVPEELKFAAIEAAWDNQAWREARWLGHRVDRFPTDLHSYQELIADVGPEVVLLLGNDPGLGGRARFAASVLSELGHGRVVAAGRPDSGERPAHPLITYVDTSDDHDASVAAVTAQIGGDGVLAFIGLGPTNEVVAAFEAYLPLVPVDSYVVVENTVLNGRPVAPGYGPGPHEAVAALLQAHPDFVPDVAYEKYTLTFNKHGYLRRVAVP